MYMVSVIRKDGNMTFETYPTLVSAKASYKRLVQPKNPHSLNSWVFLSKVMDYHQQKVK